MEESINKRLTKKQRRLLRQQQINPAGHKLEIKEIRPLTENQKISFESYDNGKNLLLHGIAGTGKSFISLYLGLKDVLKEDSKYEKVVIVRSVVPTRDMGFLPGNSREKTAVYEAPYLAICNELFNRKDAYNMLKRNDKVEFISTSFIRGVTLNNCVIIVDEIANMTLHELDSVITRVGKNCRIIFSGDFRQSDFVDSRDKSGLHDFIKIIKRMRSFQFVDFKEEDIVRSGLVKSYIIEKDKLKIVV